MKTPVNKNTKPKGVKVAVTYSALPDLKTTMVSGAMCNLTPDYLLNMVFYTERRDFPKSTSLIFNGESMQEEDDVFSGKPYDLVREINQSVLIDEETIVFLLKALNKSLKSIRETKGKNQEESKSIESSEE